MRRDGCERAIKARGQRWVRVVAILLILAVIAGAAALIVGWTLHNQSVVLPQPAGPYAVGRTAYDWTDASRPEPFTPDANDHRSLPAWVWYPVAPTAPDARPLPYLPDAWRAAEEQVHGGLFGAFISQNLAAVRSHSVGGAPLAASDKPYPVILFQPGLGPSHPDYTTLAEDLASRGYVVIATTPTYSANAAVFSDGRVASRTDAATVSDNASPAESKRALADLIQVWAADDEFALNQVARLNEADARFKGRLDLAAVGVMGHSFGGASAAETCSEDARCKAGVDLDGSPYGSVIDTGLRQPFLFLWSEPGSAQQDAQAQALVDTANLVAHSPGPIYELTLRGARHFNFADDAVFYNPLLHAMQMLGSMDGRRGLALTTAYVAAFFDQYLKAQPQGLLNGPSAAYPEVQFTVHGGR